MPAYAGTAVAEDTPGTISKPSTALAQACASSGPEACRKGSPARRRTTRPPAFASLTTTFARLAWVERLAVLAEAAVDEARALRVVGQVEEFAHHRLVAGHLGDDGVGVPDQVRGADGEQAGVSGTTPHERDPAARGGGLRRGTRHRDGGR